MTISQHGRTVVVTTEAELLTALEWFRNELSGRARPGSGLRLVSREQRARRGTHGEARGDECGAPSEVGRGDRSPGD
jgi:hypothetical protein